MPQAPTNTTLYHINHVLPFQKPVTIKKQADILGIEATASDIANKMLDTNLSDVLVCIQSGREVPLEGTPEALVTVMPLIDPTYWKTNLTFPLSGSRATVQNTLKTLKLTKR